jgi:hypothetical protein
MPLWTYFLIMETLFRDEISVWTTVHPIVQTGWLSTYHWHVKCTCLQILLPVTVLQNVNKINCSCSLLLIYQELLNKLNNLCRDNQISLLEISIYLLACHLIIVKYHFFRRAMRAIIQDLQVVNPQWPCQLTTTIAKICRMRGVHGRRRSTTGSQLPRQGMPSGGTLHFTMSPPWLVPVCSAFHMPCLSLAGTSVPSCCHGSHIQLYADQFSHLLDLSQKLLCLIYQFAGVLASQC